MVWLIRCIILDVLITRRVMSDVLINSFCYIRRCSLPVSYQQTVWQHFVLCFLMLWLTCCFICDVLITRYVRCFDALIVYISGCPQPEPCQQMFWPTRCIIFIDALNITLQRRSLFRSNEIYVLFQASTKSYGIISQKTVILTPTAIRTSNLIWMRFVWNHKLI
jgi:hypothetical protein